MPIDMLPVTCYNVARNREVIGCPPKVGPNTSKSGEPSLSLLPWKLSEKKWIDLKKNFWNGMRRKQNGLTGRSMKKLENRESAHPPAKKM